MICKYCSSEIPDISTFCLHCGKRLARKPASHSPKKRGNGQGTVLVTKGGKYKAMVTLGYYTDENGKRHRKMRCQTFEKKKDAVAAIPRLLTDPRREIKKDITFKQLYDQWFPTHRAGKSTMDGYKAAMKHFQDVWFLRMSDIDIDDLQECVDDCPHGRRTRENMKALCGLLYKFGIPRHVIPENLNLGPFLIVTGDGAAHRDSFTDVQIEKIRQACGKVTGAEEIYVMIYTGFRPSEFLALKSADYDIAHNSVSGGAKTEAGRNRVVTISPKIKSILAAHKAIGSETLFPDANGKMWSLRAFTDDLFYPALKEIGIDNPMVEIAGGKTRHKYTPHSCRHTFATLLKRAAGSDKDKQELIGHASAEMLRYYQDVDLEDLKRITDAI